MCFALRCSATPTFQARYRTQTWALKYLKELISCWEIHLRVQVHRSRKKSRKDLKKGAELPL